MSINKTWTPQPITVEEMYPKGYKVPYGFREVAFCPAKMGDLFMSAFDGKISNGPTGSAPHIIIERAPAPLRLSIVLEVVDPALNEWAMELVEGKLVGGKLLGCRVVSVELVK